MILFFWGVYSYLPTYLGYTFPFFPGLFRIDRDLSQPPFFVVRLPLVSFFCGGVGYQKMERNSDEFFSKERWISGRLMGWLAGLAKGQRFVEGLV